MEDYPIMILEDRYNGVYSKGEWIAIARWDIPAVKTMQQTRFEKVNECANGNDIESSIFWSDPPEWVAVGDRPHHALFNLQTRNHPGRL